VGIDSIARGDALWVDVACVPVHRSDSMGRQDGRRPAQGSPAARFLGRVGFIFALVWCSVSVARADEPLLDIEWTAPPSCPALDDVRGYLEAVVPEDVRARLEGTRATVVLTQVDGGYHGDILVERGDFSGERDVDGRRCDDVARSAIIVISVALTEAANATPTPTETAETAERQADPAERQAETAEPSRVDESEPSRVAIGFDAGIVSGFGSGPVAPRIEAFGRFSLSRALALGLRLRSIPFTRIDDGTAVGRSASVGVAPDLCLLAPLGRTVHVGGCLLVEAGLVLARGSGLSQSQRGTAGFIAVAVEPAIEVGDRIRFRAAVVCEARPVRPRYVVSGDTVERTSALAVGIRVGVLVGIP